jgi:regulator of protease activity HflC (stomatin/prohibitin superfamily)
MAEQNHPHPESDPRDDLNAAPVDPQGDVPVEGDEPQDDAPRRAASAEFIVRSDVGSEAILRDAMDPANQSLQEALRLSYRVLQVVMLVLIVLFVFSGFQTVETRESGVMLRWGKILEVDGKKALEPGLQFSKWPYPVGEFVLFDARDRRVSIGNVFWPNLRRNDNLEDAIRSARVGSPLRPGGDGYLLIDGGDIAHLQMTARYDVTDPVMFVNHVVNESTEPTAVDADTLVRLSLQRAAVHTAAGLGLDEFRTMGDTVKAEIQAEAQRRLDQVGSGLTIRTIDNAQALPALAVEQIYTSTEEARERARNTIKEARQQKEQALIAAAGQSYHILEDYINEYDEALALGREDEAERIAGEINEFLDLVGDETAIGERPEGRVAQIISAAKAYTSLIESSLGNEARRFAAIKPIYDENPEIVVARLWSDAYAHVLSREDVEIFFAPEAIGSMRLGVRGLDRIRQIRRDRRLERGERETFLRETADRPYLRTLESINREGPGRQLDRSGRGRAER